MRTPRTSEDGRVGRRLVLGGRVQGVGFRPFVYRLAQAHGLCGWVRNGAGRVLIHAEGEGAALARFEAALLAEAPPLARPRLESAVDAAAENLGNFCIVTSTDGEAADVHLPPDLFCCPDCEAELRDANARRHRYAFTNCTQCGPRYTIIAALPYDRPATAMAGFELCPACRAEYENPADRRFHAEPLACPACGPQLSFHDGDIRVDGEDALAAALWLLHDGGVVAVKGVGGYHLMCDPASDAAVRRLRQRKHRPAKPLAVMFPPAGAYGQAILRDYVELDDAEAAACTDPVRPIVLATKRAGAALSAEIAPGLNELGVFLPYSPLHHLLLGEFGGPLVATSGNVSGEPVITDNDEAEARLAGVADGFLHHDRPILRPADDSVLRAIAGRARPIRIGRGLAPLEIETPFAFAVPTLAVGGHMKGAIALGWNHRIVLSPHIGELDSPRSLAVFEQVIADLQRLYRVRAERLVCDLHPGYASARWAREQQLPLIRVQHHMAHAAALAGERAEIARWLIFAWDGIGLGDDGTLWGGEALLGAPGAWRRVGSLRPFHLPGGERAGREPWRSAAALLWETGRDWRPQIEGAALAQQAWSRRLGTVETSSAGRLFDAAAALVLGLGTVSYEGEGPMRLEALAGEGEAIALPLRTEGGVLRTDWAPLLPMLADGSISQATRAGVFHESLAAALAELAAAVAQTEGFEAVGLTGGVFQNRRLAESVLAKLAARKIPAFLPEIVPANDGGLAFGQLVEAVCREDAPALARAAAGPAISQ
ncbi:MAG: carbamoyltransferase HypF [Alphaproteobacteria bacterium]|nr:carbamoyltransferase HypF [Alphaproteobacteria bacterium]MDE2352181.1 carbamoyltransferase HypF [Alphaproteobacteria bacterium]